MPSTRRPEAVSSMFSVTETSCTPAWRSAALMATWSSIERARRSILWTTTAPMPPLGHPAEHGLQHRSVGGAGGLAGVGELVGEVPSALGDVAKARLPLGGDRVPLAGLVLCGLLLGRDPEVDHRVHRSSSSSSCSSATARSTSARASGPSAPGSGGSGLSSPGHASVVRAGVVSGASRVSAEALPILSRRRRRSRSVLGASARRGVKGHVGAAGRGIGAWPRRGRSDDGGRHRRR